MPRRKIETLRPFENREEAATRKFNPFQKGVPPAGSEIQQIWAVYEARQ